MLSVAIAIAYLAVTRDGPVGAPVESSAPAPISSSLTVTSGPTAQSALPTAAGLAWFQLDLQLDPEGAAIGQTLTVGMGAKVGANHGVPIDTFVSSVVGGSIALAENGDQGSEIATVNIPSGSLANVTTSTSRILAVEISPKSGDILYLEAVGGEIALRRVPAIGGASTTILAVAPPASNDLGPGSFGIIAAPDESRIVTYFCGTRCILWEIDLRSGAPVEWAGIDGHPIGVTSDFLFLTSSANGTGDVLRVDAKRDKVALLNAIDGARVLHQEDGTTVVVGIRIDTRFRLFVVDVDGNRVRTDFDAPLGAGGVAPFDLVGSSVDNTSGSAVDHGVYLAPGSKPLSVAGAAGILVPMSGVSPIPVEVVP